MSGTADQEIGAPQFEAHHVPPGPRRVGPLLGDARSVAGWAGGGGVTDEMVDIILQLRPPHFQFVNFLVRGEVYFFLDAIDRVVEAVIFVKHFPEVLVGEQPPMRCGVRNKKMTEKYTISQPGPIFFSRSLFDPFSG